MIFLTNLTLPAKISEALLEKSDVEALLALVLVSMLTLVPVTMYKSAYCFTVGYGCSVLSMALVLTSLIDDIGDTVSYLALVAVVYGLRLMLFLLYRDLNVSGMHNSTKKFDEKFSRLRVLPLACFLSILYAAMLCPLLFALRQRGVETASPVAKLGMSLLRNGGLFLAFNGMLIEAVADQQKLLIKRRHKAQYGEKKFISPTSGLFSFCRHPNYFGEILFWTGILLGGVTSSTLGNVFGVVGWATLVSIMISSAKRLDAKQKTNYGDQDEYIRWRARVKHSLLPFGTVKKATTIDKKII